jgi:hypothetical protein
MVNNPWQNLTTELDAWATAGQVAQLWWRDDDAIEDTEALERLLSLQQKSGTPLAIAAIGGLATKPLADRINEKITGGQEIYLLSHGFRHQNHALEGEKKSEFPNHRLAYDMLADVALGFEGLKVLFGAHALPVFVPPWNRFAPGMVPRLQNAQIKAFSSYGSASDLREFGVQNVNCDVDIINWRGDRGFVGEKNVSQQLCHALQAARTADTASPVGILSHHLDHDDACWAFLAKLFQFTQAHPAASWQNPQEVFNLAP